jgi:hypothetical protein
LAPAGLRAQEPTESAKPAPTATAADRTAADGTAAGVVAPEPAVEQSWFLVLLGGKRAGVQTETTRRGPADARSTELSLRLSVSRFGQAFTIVQHQRWVEGRTLQSVESETDLNGQAEQLSARLEGGELHLSQRRRGAENQHVIPEAGPLFGPRGVEDQLRSAIASGQASPSERRELAYREFSPETGSAEEVRARLLGFGELADSLGAVHRGYRVDLESSAAPGVVSEGVYDESGRLDYSVTRAGVVLEMVRAAAAPGAAASAAADLELFEMASLVLPVQWPGGPDRPGLQTLRSLTLRFEGPALAELQKAVGEQQAELGFPSWRRDGSALVLTLEPSPPPPPWPAEESPGGEPPESGLEAARAESGGGFYLDFGDPRLGELASRCVPPEFACLERLVDRTIRTKSLGSGFAGVRDILDSGSGDCTEHALLLAALLRKRGIPARIAYGYLLTEAGFIGHAWTEARASGRWFWLDPSFPGGRPYGFKIRLGVIDPAQPVWGQVGVPLLSVAGGLQAEVLEATRAR